MVTKKKLKCNLTRLRYLTKLTLHVCLLIAASKDWRIETTDIKRAFFQSRPLDRDVYVSPPPIAECPPGNIWKLRCSLYGLSDAAREFYLSLKDELLKLGCKLSSLDNSLFYKEENGEITGLLATHIDDFLHCGNQAFNDSVIKPLCQRFQAGSHEVKDFMYVGFQIKQTESGISIDQEHYLAETKEVDCKRSKSDLNPSEKSLLRSSVGAINWIVQGTRPDGCFEMLSLSTKFNSATSEDLKSANKLLRKMKRLSSKIEIPRLNDDEWYIVVFTDAALANLPDGVSSTSAYIIFIVVNARKCCPIEWKGNKIKRVVKSTIAAEVLAFQEGLEAAIMAKHVLAELLNDKPLNILIKTDSKSTVDSIHSTKPVEEKVLRLTIAAIKQFVSQYNVNVQWIPGKLMLADCMTKKGASGEHLLSILHSGELDGCYELN